MTAPVREVGEKNYAAGFESSVFCIQILEAATSSHRELYSDSEGLYPRA